MKRAAKTTDRSQPWVSNYPPLHEWLQRHGARCMWQLPYGDPEMPAQYIECWLVNKRLFIVQVYSNQCGWNIYTELADRNTEATLADAEARLGLLAPGAINATEDETRPACVGELCDGSCRERCGGGYHGTTSIEEPAEPPAAERRRKKARR
jgi:hypothetical protein